LGLAIPELRKRGWEALIKELGYANAVKFLLLYEKGQGNYLIEREKMFSTKKSKRNL